MNAFFAALTARSTSSLQPREIKAYGCSLEGLITSKSFFIIGLIRVPFI